MAKERTELRHREAALVDPLTGIANRRAFLQEAAAHAKRHMGNPRPSSVLLIDLDHFKSINDRYGHAVGDQVLEVFAETARQTVRASDLIGRLGGEEFAAVLTDMPQDKAFAVAERLRADFAQAAATVDGRPVGATVSVGIVNCDGPLFDVAGLLAQADQALYFAKERGRNRVEVASLDAILDRAAGTKAAPASAVAQNAA
ncbi:MAG: GGDEF domain-containing protein [Pseudolabrys sp.]|nr:GGDEF domain-containing protein [Pseudolabrys sp.]